MKRTLLILLSLCLTAMADVSRVIGGSETTSETYPEVVQISQDGATCSGTVVGPQVILTVAHCVKNDQSVKILLGKEEVQGISYRSPLYPQQDHDVAVIVSLAPLNRKPVNLAVPRSESGDDLIGADAWLAGYGCSNSSGDGVGVLRIGQTKITGFQGFDVTTLGAAACFGDSGGPLYIDEAGDRGVLGIVSKGNIKDVSYFHWLNSAQTIEFLSGISEKYKVGICGLNTAC